MGEHTRPVSLPVNNIHIELDPISNLLPDPSDQLSPYVIQEILKASGVEFINSNIKNVARQNAIQQLRLKSVNQKFI